LLSGILFAFYILMYFTSVFDPLAVALGLASKWNLYGVLYTLAIIVGGVWFIRIHGNSPYQRLRTISLMFIQAAFAFSIPMVMEMFDSKGYVFSLFWPLKLEYLSLSYMLDYPLLIVLYAFLGSLVIVPVITFMLGKRWYCSWVCGCGGLAETAGDHFRHLSSKHSGAWAFERFSVHAVMLIAIIATALITINWGLHYENSAGEWVTDQTTFDVVVSKIQGVYQFVVVALLSGVLGVGLYPLMGSRVWCRFFCPLAAVMGLIQKFGRFRIAVKDDMCISCGNCSAYCEMGIDVRMYAQANTDFKRAACVGCGMCAHLCPRGVLRLENKWDFQNAGKDTNLASVDL
jgi:polyferredoxin